MADDCVAPALYLADSATAILYQLDPETGETLETIETELAFSSVGLEYDPVTGLSRVATGSALYTVDPTTVPLRWSPPSTCPTPTS